MSALSCLGIDPGRKPGFCHLQEGFSPLLSASDQGIPSDIAACESQFVASGKASRRGKKVRVSSAGIITLAQIAGAQLAAAPAKLKLFLPYDVWTGMLWSDAGARLDAEVAITRLRGMLAKELGLFAAAAASEDELVAFGVALAGLAIGEAKSGKLLSGQAWKRTKQPLWFCVKLEQVAKKAGRKFAKRLARPEGFR